MDWNGDHIYTNFRRVFQRLVKHGYTVEVLSDPATCFDPSLYGTLILVDPEEELFEAELDHVRALRESSGRIVEGVSWCFSWSKPSKRRVCPCWS